MGNLLPELQQRPPVDLLAEVSGVTAQPLADPSGLDKAIGRAEVAGSVISSAIAEPLAGLAGIGAILPGGRTPVEAIEETREALTFTPKTPSGKESLQSLGEVLQPVGEAISTVEDTLGDVAFDLTGSPAIAAAAKSSPTLALELLGLKALKSFKKGTKLVDGTGRPTAILRAELDKVGLDFDSLTPEAKALIPEVAPKTRVLALPAPASAAEKTLVKQIASGGRDSALAKLTVQGGKAIPDKAGINAVKQGFSEGVVQAVKTSSQGTKQSMKKMLDMMRRIKKNERLALDFRPSDVVGDALSSRVKFIRDKANAARIELNDIASTKLRGKSVDTSVVAKALEKSLDDLDVKLVDGPKGVPRPDFKGSLISKDKTSKRIIKDAIDLLAEGGKPDALRFHKLKRQMDILIDFKKKGASGLPDAGRNVLKDIRKSLNESIRAVDPDYARVNDVLSKSLTVLEDFDKATGTIQIFGEGAGSAIGTRLRSLMSNQQSRVGLENSISQINDAVTDLGGKFDTDIKDLVLFANALDDRFGAVAKASFSGQTEQAVRQAVKGGAREAVVEGVAKTVGSGVEKLRGVNDFNAFESMTDLISRAQP